MWEELTPSAAEGGSNETKVTRWWNKTKHKQKPKNKNVVHEVRSRAGRCAATASKIKVEAQGEEKLEDLLDLGEAERLSLGFHRH